MEDEKEVKLAPVPAVLESDQVIALAENAEKRIAAIRKIKAISIKLTNHQDWVDLGGKPYLQATGSEKIARAFGISWRISEPVLEWLEDGHFAYTFKGYFSMGTAEIEVIGTRSSKDPFFSRAKGADLPASEIDRGDVKKSALTNLLANGITRLLGIRNLTWEEVKGAGIDTEVVGKVDYQQKSADPNAAATLPKYGKASGKTIDDPTVTTEDLEYYVKGLEKSIGDPEKAKYRAKNESLVNAIKAEIERRRTAPGTPTGATPDPEHAADPWMQFCSDIQAVIGQRFINSLGTHGFVSASEVKQTENRRTLALLGIGECGDEDRKTILKNHAAFLKLIRVIA